MLINPPDPILESLDGDTYLVAVDYDVKFGYWLRELQFRIPAGFKSDLASIPRIVRWKYDRASLGTLAPIVHDWGCKYTGVFISLQGKTIQLPWFIVHVFFLVAMTIDGIPWRRSLICFLAVIIGGPKWPQYPPERLEEIRLQILANYPDV